MKKSFLFILLFLCGCSQVGPVVSSVRQNKKGEMVVEKCMIEHNAFTGMISFKNCSEFTL